MSKQAWKAYWRMLRIYNREQRKAWQDAMTFGNGYLLIQDGHVNHVHGYAIFLEPIE